MFRFAGAIYADESVINFNGSTSFDDNSAEGETRPILTCDCVDHNFCYSGVKQMKYRRVGN